MVAIYKFFKGFSMLNVKVNLFRKRKFLLFLKIVLMISALSITIKSIGLPEKHHFYPKQY